MASVHDVAAAVLERTGRIDTWKLQKLVYYCQSWHLVWDEEPLFEEDIEAWANGPVAPLLYRSHRGNYRVSTILEGNSSNLTRSERETVDAVCGFYGEMGGYTLSQLTHRETPWREARRRAGLGPGERGSELITLEDMLDYYGGLVAAADDY